MIVCLLIRCASTNVTCIFGEEGRSYSRDMLCKRASCFPCSGLIFWCFFMLFSASKIFNSPKSLVPRSVSFGSTDAHLYPLIFYSKCACVSSSSIRLIKIKNLGVMSPLWRYAATSTHIINPLFSGDQHNPVLKVAPSCEAFREACANFRRVRKRAFLVQLSSVSPWCVLCLASVSFVCLYMLSGPFASLLCLSSLFRVPSCLSYLRILVFVRLSVCLCVLVCARVLLFSSLRVCMCSRSRPRPRSRL